MESLTQLIRNKSRLPSLNIKNPNTLSDSEYDTYSGAAIGGTLAFMIPGALLFFDVSGFIADFIFGALIGNVQPET